MIEYELVVQVTTADGVPIFKADIALSSGSGSKLLETNFNGSAEFGLNSTPFVIIAEKKNYVRQTIKIKDSDDGTLIWSDPGSRIFTIKSPMSTQMIVYIPLGRMKPVPVLKDPQAELEIRDIKNRAVKNSPKAMKLNEVHIFDETLQHTWTTMAGKNEVYKFLAPLKPKENVNFWAAKQGKMVKEHRGKASGKGWGQFNSEPTLMNPVFESLLAYVEWGDPDEKSKEPRYLAGLWRPRTSSQFGAPHQQDSESPIDGGEGRDVVVFMGPATNPDPKKPTDGWPNDTSPYRGQYPFVARTTVQQTMFDRGADISQPYIDLGGRDIFSEDFIAHQILAAKKNALLIVPIQPAAHWDHFGQLQGLSRLVSEALLFEHRQTPLPNNGKAAPSVPVANPEEKEGRAMSKFFSPPSLRYAVVSGYSSGMGAVKDFMNKSATWQPEYSVRTFDEELQHPYFADPRAFIAAWQEVWDIDGNSQTLALSGWTNWAKVCKTWQKRFSDRIVRSYHSEFTIGTGHEAATLKSVCGSALVSVQKQDGLFFEVQGATGSLVWLSGTLLLKNKGTREENFPLAKGTGRILGTVDKPEFWNNAQGDSHHAIQLISFSHAAANSGLLKLEN